jgi:hypothetical protein
LTTTPSAAAAAVTALLLPVIPQAQAVSLPDGVLPAGSAAAACSRVDARHAQVWQGELLETASHKTELV